MSFGFEIFLPYWERHYRGTWLSIVPRNACMVLSEPDNNEQFLVAREHEKNKTQQNAMKGAKPKMTVSFDNNATIHELPPHLNSGVWDDDHEVMADTFWFNKHDFRRMREADRRIVQKIRLGTPIPSEARGLEARSPIALMEKRLAKMDGIAAVLGEQSRQKDLGQRDDESIRNRYLIATRELVTEAITRASRDAEEVLRSEWDDGGNHLPPHTSIDHSTNCIELHHKVGCSKGTYENDHVKHHKAFTHTLGARKPFQYILSRASQVMKRQEPLK